MYEVSNYYPETELIEFENVVLNRNLHLKIQKIENKEK